MTFKSTGLSEILSCGKDTRTNCGGHKRESSGSVW